MLNIFKQFERVQLSKLFARLETSTLDKTSFDRVLFCSLCTIFEFEFDLEKQLSSEFNLERVERSRARSTRKLCLIDDDINKNTDSKNNSEHYNKLQNYFEIEYFKDIRC